MLGPDEIKVVPKKFTGKYANLTAERYDKYGEMKKIRTRLSVVAKNSYKLKKEAKEPLDI